MPAEHQRVFLIEEKVRQTPGRSPEGFYRGKETLSDQSAGGARKRHVFCAVCPCRPAGPALDRFYYIFQTATAGSITSQKKVQPFFLDPFTQFQMGFRLGFRD